MEGFISREEFFKNRDFTHCRDNLTGVFNREIVLEYISYLMKIKRAFTYMICDIDNFKSVNDSFGHTIGDIVIKKCADYLVKLMENDGMVGRFGGDEFLVVVPDIVEYDEIWKVCRKITFETNHLAMEELNNTNISFTIGMSRYPLDGAAFETLMEKADKALYRGKQKGRNCFIIYLDEKHADITISDSGAKLFDSMYMHARVASILTSSDELADNIKTLIEQLSSVLMVDHICVQSHNGVVSDTVHPLSNQKKFLFIESGILDKVVNANGYCFINNIGSLLELGFEDVHDSFAKQKVTGSVYVKVEAYGKDFGYIRAESTNPDGRIWQRDNINLFIMFARMLGTILYLKNITLDDLVTVQPLKHS